MKKTIFTLALIATTVVGMATTHTVDNNPGAGAQFSDLQTAVDAAEAGDTLYVAGSPDSYGDVAITKKLALIGAGFKVNSQWQYKTITGSITFDPELDEFDNVISVPDSSYMAGLFIDNSIDISEGKGILFDRIQISGTIWINKDYVSFSIKNSIIYDIKSSSFDPPGVAFSADIHNSIIQDHIVSSNPATSLFINHSLFITPYTTLDLSWLSYAVVSNSIFYKYIPANGSYISFTNNISIGSDSPEFIYGTNSGSGNMPDVDPQFHFMDETDGFSFTDDYRLQAGSPGVDAATDGSDIGIYGGSHPFPVGGDGEFLMAAPPAIPQIFELNLQNPGVPQGGSLEVNIKARNAK